MTYKNLRDRLIKEETNLPTYRSKEFSVFDPPFDDLRCRKRDREEMGRVFYRVIDKIEAQLKDNSEFALELFSSALDDQDYADMVKYLSDQYKNGERNSADYLFISSFFTNKWRQMKHNLSARENMCILGWSEDIIDAYYKATERLYSVF